MCVDHEIVYLSVCAMSISNPRVTDSSTNPSLPPLQMSLHFTVCLMNFNCCLDPFVYFFACKGYKRRVMKMLRVQVSASFSSVVRTGEDTPFKRGGTRDGRSRLGSHTACPVALDNLTKTIPGPETETGVTSNQLPLRQESHPTNYP